MNFDRNTEGGWILKSPWECTGIEKLPNKDVLTRVYNVILHSGPMI